MSNAASSQLFVTGHSLGAAMAVIAAIMHSGQEPAFNAVVTFGEPAVGNNIDNGLEETCPHIRYVNGDDPIPGIVPDRLFKHHGACIPIQDSSGPDIKFDHSIINYAEIIGQGRKIRDLY